VELRAWVRTSNTPQSERKRMHRQPPHILVTTPESLIHSANLGPRGAPCWGQSGRDPCHGRQKRGAHLALSLERLEALTGQPLQRIGISTTQESVADMARFLLGTRKTHCTTIDLGRDRPLDLGLELFDSPLEAVMAGAVWGEIYDRLAALARKHRTTLIFVNTRRLAERVAHPPPNA